MPNTIKANFQEKVGIASPNHIMNYLTLKTGRVFTKNDTETNLIINSIPQSGHFGGVKYWLPYLAQNADK